MWVCLCLCVSKEKEDEGRFAHGEEREKNERN